MSQVTARVAIEPDSRDESGLGANGVFSMTLAGYGVQTPNNDLLEYRQIGNVVLTLSQALPAGVPNNVNAH